MTAFYGKYRGKVAGNVDPEQLGRLQVIVPEVLGEGRSSWAMPCVPYAGKGVGLFALPPKDANVWVEFEGGDPDYPIWTGCFWDKGQVPARPAAPEVKVLQTEGVSLVIDDKGKGLTLEIRSPTSSVPIKLTANASGVELTMKKAGVKLTPQSIELSLAPAAVKLGPGGVTVAHGAASVELKAPKVAINKTALEVI